MLAGSSSKKVTARESKILFVNLSYILYAVLFTSL